MPRHLIAAKVFNTPVMVVPAKLSVIIGAIWPNLTSSTVIPDQDARSFTRASAERSFQVTESGVAIIPVADTLVQKGSWIGSNSGMTSYEGIRRQLREALADSGVSGIVLDIDSPGGEVAGCFDLADEIKAAGATKPIWAVANEMACSAAYAIGSAAQRLLVPRTGIVGSIGVLAMHMDMSAFDKQEGIKYTPVYAGKHKMDFSQHEPLGDDARALLQAEIDKTYGLFVATVASNRGLNPDDVRATEARLYSGSDAVRAQLADGIATLEEACTSLGRPATKSFGAVLRAESNVPPSPAALAAPGDPAQSVNHEVIMTDSKKPEAGAEPAKDAKTAEPAVVVDLDAVRKDAEASVTARLKAEGEARIKAIRDLCVLARAEDKALDFIASGKSADDVRAALIEARAKADEDLGETAGQHAGKSADAAAKANNYGWDSVVAKVAKHRVAVGQK